MFITNFVICIILTQNDCGNSISYIRRISKIEINKINKTRKTKTTIEMKE